MKPPTKNDCTHAYVGMVVLVAIFMLLFIAVMHGQELPDAPQYVVPLRPGGHHVLSRAAGT